MDNLEVAQICFENGFHDACANRAYYSAFQAAVAVLYFFGIKREKLDYKWLQAEFSAKLISSRKIFPEKMKSYLASMQMVGNRADYSDDQVSKNAARRQIDKAREMIEFIVKVVEK